MHERATEGATERRCGEPAPFEKRMSSETLWKCELRAADASGGNYMNPDGLAALWDRIGHGRAATKRATRSKR